jgi:hypothetical protein
MDSCRLILSPDTSPLHQEFKSDSAKRRWGLVKRLDNQLTNHSFWKTDRNWGMSYQITETVKAGALMS